MTLKAEEGAVCPGMAFRIAAAHQPRVLARLDHREKGGYRRTQVTMVGPAGRRFAGITYWAHHDNPNYLGPAPLHEMAQQILSAVGPSGANADYLWQLERSLFGLGVRDSHVAVLCAATRAARDG